MKTRVTFANLPPTFNHAYGHGKKGVYRTAAYNAWANAEGWTINRQMAGQHRWTGPVFIVAAFARPASNCDLDNRIKASGDLLQQLGVIDNDRNVMGWNVRWVDCLPDGVAVEIAITEADEVAVCRRSTLKPDASRRAS